MHFNRRFTPLLALALTAAPLLAQDLPTDPSLVQGQFENGLRYVIRNHDNPEGRFHAWLHVRAGALHETAVQNGGAHFLEHLAFNGSEHYPPGELIPRLNELGMQFGADSNAHTTFDETVFKLSMPGNDSAMVTMALTILGDFAHGLGIAATEVDHERGVILEEKRSGLGPQERIGKTVRKWLFEGSRLEVHDVIGTEESIQAMTREELVDFWSTWYRPELMTLIVVGDVQPEAVLEAAKVSLGGFEARAEAREFAGSGVSTRAEPRALIVADPEVAQANVQMIALTEGDGPARTEAELRERLKEVLAVQVFSTRLQDMVQKGEAAWMYAAADVDSFLDLRQSAAFAVGRADQWDGMVEGLIAEMKRALDHGFSADEVDRATRDMIAGAERAAETESTVQADAHVQRIARGVQRESVLMSAQQRLELVREIAGVEPGDVAEAFAAAMGGRNYQYVLVMPESETNPTAADVLAIDESAWQTETEAVEASAEKLVILPELPESGVERSRSVDEETRVTTIEFENGLVMHHREMDKPANSVSIAITLPAGALQETAENRGVTSVASLASATSRMDSLQIRDAMSGKKVSMNLGAGADAVTVSVSGAPADLEDGLQLVHAMMLDARVEQTMLDNWKEQSLQSIEEAKTDLGAHFGKALRRAQLGDDVRFRELTVEDVEARTVEEAEKWLRQLVDGAPMEVAVVGDLPLDDAVALVGRYLASLPAADRGFDCLDELRSVDMPAGAQRVRIVVPTVTEKATVLAGFRGCDADQVFDRRVLNLCSRVLSDRMRIRLREEQGMVYSIQCMSQASGAIPGSGLFFAAAPTDPKTADRLADEILEMLREFAENGPTEEEFAIAKKQAGEALDQAVERPGFWTGNLSDLRYRGRSFDELHGLDGLYDRFTVEDARSVARKYFVDDRELRVVAVPKGDS